MQDRKSSAPTTDNINYSGVHENPNIFDDSVIAPEVSDVVNAC